MLNGGGLGQIQDITEAFSTAFRSRSRTCRSMITELEQVRGELQRADRRHHYRRLESSTSCRHFCRESSRSLAKAPATVPEAPAVPSWETRKPRRGQPISFRSQLQRPRGQPLRSRLQANLARLEPADIAHSGARGRSQRRAGDDLRPQLPHPDVSRSPTRSTEKAAVTYANMTAIVDLTLSFASTRASSLARGGRATSPELEMVARSVPQPPYTAGNFVAPHDGLSRNMHPTGRIDIHQPFTAGRLTATVTITVILVAGPNVRHRSIQA